MGKKIGRPTDSLKSTMIRVRMDTETVKIMDEQAKFYNTTRSDIVRKSIRNNQSFFDCLVHFKEGGDKMVEIKPCSKEEVEEQLENYKTLADDCRRILKNMDENAFLDDAELREAFEKSLEQNIWMIAVLEKCLEKFK